MRQCWGADLMPMQTWYTLAKIESSNKFTRLVFDLAFNEDNVLDCDAIAQTTTTVIMYGGIETVVSHTYFIVNLAKVRNPLHHFLSIYPLPNLTMTWEK